MSNNAKKIEITFGLHVSNGEWDNKKKIARDEEFEHSIDLGLFNDENTFQAVMDTLKREFNDGIEKAINTVMQRMLDVKPAESNSGEPSDEQLSKMEMSRDEWNAQNLGNMLAPKSTECEKARGEKAE